MKTPKRVGGRLSTSHIHAPNQEKSLAKRVGGRTVRGSGSGSEKGDVRKPKVCRIECKCTKNKSFSITGDMIDKIEGEALSSSELPAIQVDFIDGTTGKVIRSCAVLPVWVLDMLADTKI